MKKFFSWWSFLIMGVVAFIYGMFAVMSSDELLRTIGLYLGLFIVLIGVIYVAVALYKRKKEQPYRNLLIEGCAIVAVGIFISIFSQQIIKFFVFLIGLWLALIGLFMIFANIKNTTVVNRKFYLIASVLCLIIGVVLVVNPFETVQFITRLSGIVSVVFGVVMVMFSINFRTAAKDISFVEAEVVDDTTQEKQDNE